MSEGERPIAVVGAGSWGTALAQCLATAGREVRLCARDPALAARLARERRNPAYLPGIALSPAIAVGCDLGATLGDAGVVILAVPTHGMRATAEHCAPHLSGGAVVLSAAKGFEAESGRTMTELLSDVLRGAKGADVLGGAGGAGAVGGAAVVALSGPNIAIEIARGLPAATVVAGRDAAATARARDGLTGPQLRVYSNPDVCGVEYGGALKNVVAVAAGICDGVGLGDNGKAALITRGLAEMARIGVAAGAVPATFAGLTGLGDCIVTCASPHSRNRRLGEAIGRGQSLAEVEAGMFMVAEGVNAARGARALSRRLGVRTPLVDEVCAVLFDGKAIPAALDDLMRRDARDELV